MKKFIGTKQFYKTVMMIALPIMAQQFISSFVSLIDNVMIGSVGDIALTSVTVANKFFNIYNSLLFGLCGAIGIFIAQYYGAKDRQTCQKIFNIGLLWSVVMGVFFTVILLVVPEITIYFFSRTPQIVHYAMDYLTISRLTYLPFAISMSCMMSLRAVGITTVQLKTGTLAVGINTFLNYCLIYGHFGFPELGVTGAALATLIARVVEMMIYLFILYQKKHYFQLDLYGMIHPDKGLMARLWKKVLPLACNEIFFSLGLAMIYKSYIRLDEYMVAAISVVDTVTNMMYIIFGGLSSAVAILIGNKLGANQLEEAKDNSYKLLFFAFSIACAIGLIIFFIATFIPELYNLPDDIKRTIIICLRIKSFSILLVAVNVTIFFILRAGGDTLSTLLMDSGFLWLGGVLISTVLSMYVKIPLVYLFAVVEFLDILKLFVAFYFYQKGRWIHNMT